MRESKLEKYIKDYVYDKTGESVYLHLEDAIRITHVTKRGSTTLAILWANILQHPHNFPSDQFPYKKLTTGRDGDRLVLKVDKACLTVYMASGALVIEGAHIYDWFTRRFKALLDNFDASYNKTWIFIPTPSLKTEKLEEEIRPVHDYNTATEDYLLMRTRSHAVGTKLDQRMEEHAEDYISGLGNLALDQVLFEGADLDKEAVTLAHGAVKDGMRYVYKLWKSLLNKWLSRSGNRVYLCTPKIDADRLQDIVDISLRHQYRGHVEVMYTSYKCDPDNDRTVEQVKSSVLSRYSPRHHTFMEYKLFQRILIPVQPVAARFAACVAPDGTTEVLLTSAVFHACSFTRDSLETVSVLNMDELSFREKYYDPISSPVIASIY